MYNVKCYNDNGGFGITWFCLILFCFKQGIVIRISFAETKWLFFNCILLNYRNLVLLPAVYSGLYKAFSIIDIFIKQFLTLVCFFPKEKNKKILYESFQTQVQCILNGRRRGIVH